MNEINFHASIKEHLHIPNFASDNMIESIAELGQPFAINLAESNKEFVVPSNALKNDRGLL